MSYFLRQYSPRKQCHIHATLRTKTNWMRERLELSCKHASELVCDSQNDEPENSTEERHKSAEMLIQFRNAWITTNKNRNW